MTRYRAPMVAASWWSGCGPAACRRRRFALRQCGRAEAVGPLAWAFAFAAVRLRWCGQGRRTMAAVCRFGVFPLAARGTLGTTTITSALARVRWLDRRRCGAA